MAYVDDGGELNMESPFTILLPLIKLSILRRRKLSLNRDFLTLSREEFTNVNQTYLPILIHNPPLLIILMLLGELRQTAVKAAPQEATQTYNNQITIFLPLGGD